MTNEKAILYNKIYCKTRRDYRVSIGKCTQCGVRAPIEGMRLCDPCEERINENHRALEAKRAATGLCKRHGNPVMPGLRTCQLCRDYWNNRAKMRRDNAKLARANAGATEVATGPITDLRESVHELRDSLNAYY